MKKYNKITFFFAYISNIALAIGLLEMTENYWLKFLAVISSSCILGAINGYNSPRRTRVIGLILGILGISIFVYFVDINQKVSQLERQILKRI